MGEAQPTRADREAADEFIDTYVESLPPSERDQWREDAAAFRTIYGDHVFLIRCDLRKPVTRYEHAILAHQNSGGTEQAADEIGRVESERPLDLVMIEEVYAAYLDRLDAYGYLAEAAKSIKGMHRHRDYFDVDEVRSNIDALVVPMPLVTYHVDRVVEFADQVRSDNGFDPAYFGTGHGSSAVWLFGQELFFACNDWWESRALHESGEGAVWFGRDVSLERLYLERMAGSFCDDQLAMVSLEQELLACRRAFTREMNHAEVTCASPSSVDCDPAACRPAAGSKQQPEVLPENVFRRCGGVWQVRFKGRVPFNVTALLGARYINYLLEKPNKPRPAIDIVCSTPVDFGHRAMDEKQAMDEGLQKSINPMLTSPDNIADQPAIKAYREKAEELLVDIENACRENNNVLEAQYRRDFALITAQIDQAVGTGGKLKLAANKRKNIGDTFRKNVQRVIETQIKAADPDLAAHLVKAIDFGSQPCYAPEEAVIWETRPVTNG